MAGMTVHSPVEGAVAPPTEVAVGSSPRQSSVPNHTKIETPLLPTVPGCIYCDGKSHHVNLIHTPWLR